jgi:hypothetical protein
MVTLAELFDMDDDNDLPADLPDIFVILTEVELAAGGLVLFEGWQPSHIKGLWYRVNPARPQNKQLRNVHVAPQKHINAKRKQASWNENTKRHDRSTFNKKFGQRADVQDVARAALGLPATAVLEHVVIGAAATQILFENAELRGSKGATLVSAEARSFLDRLLATTPPLTSGLLIQEEMVECAGEDFVIQAVNTGSEVAARVFRKGHPWGYECTADFDVLFDMRVQLGINGVDWLMNAQRNHISEWLEMEMEERSS